MSSQPFITGKGTKVRVALTPGGERIEPTSQTITVSGAVAANATTVTTDALTADLKASSTRPVFLNFIDPLTGAERLVTVTTDADATDTSLATLAIPLGVADNSTAEFPPRLLARTASNISTNSSDTTTTTFDTDAYEDGLVTSIGYGVSCPGNFLSQDAGWRTCFHAFNEIMEVYLWVEMPVPAGFAKGYIFEGPASVTNCALDIPADGIITSPVDFKFRGKITITPPATA